MYAGECDKTDPLMSPVHADDSELAALPPTAFCPVEGDALLPQAETLYRRMVDAGASGVWNPVAGVYHATSRMRPIWRRFEPSRCQRPSPRGLVGSSAPRPAPSKRLLNICSGQHAVTCRFPALKIRSSCHVQMEYRDHPLRPRACAGHQHLGDAHRRCRDYIPILVSGRGIGVFTNVLLQLVLPVPGFAGAVTGWAGERRWRPVLQVFVENFIFVTCISFTMALIQTRRAAMSSPRGSRRISARAYWLRDVARALCYPKPLADNAVRFRHRVSISNPDNTACPC